MIIFFLFFLLLIISLLLLDLCLVHKKNRDIDIKEALAWTAFWVVVALAFNVLIYFAYENHWFGIGSHAFGEIDGKEAFITFLTAYLIEKSLSIDNVFIMAIIFSHFSVPTKYQHRVLFWGILGAIVMRGIMIALGITIINHFYWVTYLLGVLLIFTSLRMFLMRDEDIQPENTIAVKLFRKFIKISTQIHGEKFLVKINGEKIATPLLMSLVLIEVTDLLFAVDSIPAVLAITLDPFLVFTSNVFAILGMRSLYFAVIGVIERFKYLKISLIFILAFVGVKIILSHYFVIPAVFSLGVILLMLTSGMVVSLLLTKEGGLPVKEYSYKTIRAVRKVFLLIAGVTIVCAGIAMLVLPGPGLLVIFLGLTILAMEFVWAKVLIDKIKERIKKITSKEKSSNKNTPQV